MGAWYRVIKTVKGHRYVYEQRTWRQGGHVRTENRYIGPAAAETQAGIGAGPVITTPSLRYHGSRTGLAGPPQASGEGTFGPGFYLTSQSRAGDYARYDAKTAAGLAAWGNKQPPPQHDGVVYACDVSGLCIKPMSWDGYYALMEKLLGLAPGEGIPTPANKVLMTQLLAGQGYDGIQILDDDRQETVIFPASLAKISLVPDEAHARQSVWTANRPSGVRMRTQAVGMPQTMT